VLTQGPEGPAPVGDIVATVYKDSSGSALYVEPLPPQSLNCLGPAPVGAVGCPVGAGLVRFGQRHAPAAG
jgi:hypothetical protein